MSTPLTPEPTTEATPPPGPGTKTLCVKNVPHTVWQRARQNALASNLSFGGYIVKLLNTAGPFPPRHKSEWDNLLEPCSLIAPAALDLPDTHPLPSTSTDAREGRE